ncbi:MAG: CAP domain-containing protein, partial [Acidobacteriota bacterium]|nr:CAP domain-containing protein [Acidobacteriota bacterium]
MRSWLGRAVLLALLPLLLGAGGGRELSVAPDLAAERELVERINQSRQRNGLPKLEPDPRLAEAARAHALEMARQGHVTHRFPPEPALRGRVAVTGLRFDFVGENVGLNRDAELSHHEFLSSPGHRENILDPRANAVGVGAVRTGEDLWVTEDFAHVVPDYDPAEAEELVVRLIAGLRKQAGQPPLLRGELGPVRQEACAMAQTDR